MALSKELLDLLVCPETRGKLDLADDDRLEAINRAIVAGKLNNRAGKPVNAPLEAALVRADGEIAYAVRDDIPNLLIDEGIPLAKV